MWPGRPPGWRPGGLYRLVEKLAVPGARVEQAGSSFSPATSPIQQKAAARWSATSCRTRSDAWPGGRTLADAGVTQQEVVHQLALWLGVVVAAVLIVALLLVWLPPGLLGGGGAASRLRMDGADLELFAIRAVANRPLRDLHRVTLDPAGDLRAGEFQALADLELRASACGPSPAGSAAPDQGQDPRSRQATPARAATGRAARMRLRRSTRGRAAWRPGR